MVCMGAVIRPEGRVCVKRNQSNGATAHGTVREIS
jgi:hypothetical protein